MGLQIVNNFFENKWLNIFLIKKVVVILHHQTRTIHLTLTTMATVTYSKSDLMKYAWRVFRSQEERTMAMWSISLKRAWHIAKTKPNTLKDVKPMTFNEVYEKYYNGLLGFIQSKSKPTFHISKEMAEEIVDDTFMRIHKHLSEYDCTRGSMITWIYNIAIRITYDYYDKYKSQNNQVNVSDFVDENGNETYQFKSEDSADCNSDRNELMNTIRCAFVSLTQKHREIAELHFIHQLSYDEISDTLRIPKGTVKGTISRCKEVLQDQLQGTKERYAI